MSNYTGFPTSPKLSNGTAYQANSMGHVIEIFSVHSGHSVKFKAFLTSFSDKYSTNYNSEEVYGRMDPVQLYKNTQRVISFAIDIPSESLEEAKANLDKCSMLASMQYPVFSASGPEISNATSIQAAPLFKIKFGNLIQNSNINAGDAKSGGLTGTMAGFDYAPDTDSGFYDPKPYGSTLYPKLVKISIEFTPQHEHGLGFTSSGQERVPNFPYGRSAMQSLSKAPPSEEDKKIDKQNQLRNAVEEGDPTQEQVDAAVDAMTAPVGPVRGN